ncbi:MAG: hypothetical protein ACLPH3_17005 [Terracidiphilus sp.]
MKLFFFRSLAPLSVAAALAPFVGFAQNPAQTAAPSNATSTQPQSSGPSGKVIFSRSTDENGQTTTQVGPAAAQPAIEMAKEPTAEDTDRQAITFTALDLDVHLHTAAHLIAVRALITVRNDGKIPLTRIPLQISSSLNWEQIRVAGRNVSFPVATLNSDTDHTGQLHEAAVPLAKPLAPGAMLELDVVYSGNIVPNAQRLVTIGTPEDRALHSDWDEISPAFTGLRGFGDVVWYPVSSVPVILGDGSRLFDEIGRHKLRLAGARFRLHLTVEFPHGHPPTVALVNGVTVPLSATDAQGLNSEVDGIATATAESSALGFLAPSLFVAERKVHTSDHLTAWTIPDDEVSVQSWIDAASRVAPFVAGWLGQHPRAQLTLLDLPDPNDAPFETGALLATTLHDVPADPLNGVLVHSLTHAYIESTAEPPPGWLNEGLATFMESLWVEKRLSRDQALEMLEANRPALALAEPSSPGASAGEPLALAIEPVYYRTKAAYVFWMLRDLTSDEALSAALRAYVAAPYDAAKPPSAAASLQRLLQQAGVHRDLSWFFSDWVDTDKGLPDLTIDSVFPNAAQAGTYLVAVNVTNAGYAAADVPVTVRTAKNFVTERVFVPARGSAIERLVVIGPPTQVQLNDGTVPETQASVHVTDITPPTTDNAAPSSGSTSSSTQEPPPQ